MSWWKIPREHRDQVIGVKMAVWSTKADDTLCSLSGRLPASACLFAHRWFSFCFLVLMRLCISLRTTLIPYTMLSWLVSDRSWNPTAGRSYADYQSRVIKTSGVLAALLGRPPPAPPSPPAPPPCAGPDHQALCAHLRERLSPCAEMDALVCETFKRNVCKTLLTRIWLVGWLWSAWL